MQSPELVWVVQETMQTKAGTGVRAEAYGDKGRTAGGGCWRGQWTPLVGRRSARDGLAAAQSAGRFGAGGAGASEAALAARARNIMSIVLGVETNGLNCGLEAYQ